MQPTSGFFSDLESEVEPQIEPNKILKFTSEVTEESSLYNMLDTGRLHKKFKDIMKIGQGGFGEVFKAEYHIDQKLYAIKVVRFHITKNPKKDAL